MHHHHRLSDIYYRHRRGYVLALVPGLILVCAGIAAIMYSTLEERHAHHWITWTGISATCILAGLLFTGNAFVHKVKSDLAKRETQKLKKDSPTLTD